MRAQNRENGQAVWSRRPDRLCFSGLLSHRIGGYPSGWSRRQAWRKSLDLHQQRAGSLDSHSPSPPVPSTLA